MRVLFVARETVKGLLSPLVSRQGDSLKDAGVEVEYFPIRGKGRGGYIRSVFALRRYLRLNRFDVIHAHYSLSSFAATLAGARPLIVSLMGSDVLRGKVERYWLRRLAKGRWSALIVKSEEMKAVLGIRSAAVIPNGIDMESFRPLAENEARANSGFASGKHVIFVGDPGRDEKNFDLARCAYDLLKRDRVELHVISGLSHESMPDIMNAADVLLLTSRYEGSPNVIKEAMACNCPIVATDVGDIRWIIGDTEGCYLTSFDPGDVASKLQLALKFGRRTRGRERLIELGLDSVSVAKRIVQLYQDVIEK